jgi:hypothetical protein
MAPSGPVRGHATAYVIVKRNVMVTRQTDGDYLKGRSHCERRRASLVREGKRLFETVSIRTTSMTAPFVATLYANVACLEKVVLPEKNRSQ